jgi:hypothetical protein
VWSVVIPARHRQQFSRLCTRRQAMAGNQHFTFVKQRRTTVPPLAATN